MAIRTETAVRQLENMGYPSFHRGHTDTSIVRVSAEESCADGSMAADYWHPTEPGWISDHLVRWAKKNNLFFEWENPGCIAAYRN